MNDGETRREWDLCILWRINESVRETEERGRKEAAEIEIESVIHTKTSEYRCIMLMMMQ